MPRQERQHRADERALGVFGTELERIDRSRDRLRLVLDHLDGSETVLEIRDIPRHMRAQARIGRRVTCGAEAEALRLRRVCRDGRADDRRGNCDDYESEDQELLTPLPAKEAPCPPDDCTSGGYSAVSGSGFSPWRENSSAHRAPLVRGDR